MLKHFIVYNPTFDKVGFGILFLLPAPPSPSRHAPFPVPAAAAGQYAAVPALSALWPPVAQPCGLLPPLLNPELGRQRLGSFQGPERARARAPRPPGACY